MMMDIANRIPEYQASAKQVVIQETTSAQYYGTGYQDVQNRVPAIDNTMSETITSSLCLMYIFHAPLFYYHF
jgi:hypothetical protein